jgi:hypothetical protein
LYTYLKEKISILRENEALTKDSERLCAEKDSLMKSRELANNQAASLRKSLEAAHVDIKEKEKMVILLRIICIIDMLTLVNLSNVVVL